MRRGGAKSDSLRRLVEYAEALGFTLDAQRHRHLRFDRPGPPPVFASRTPGDRRSLENSKRDLRRAVAQSDNPEIKETPS